MYVELPELMPNEHLLSAVARWFDTSGLTCFATATKKYVSSNVNKLNPLTIWRPIYFDLAKHYIGTVSKTKLIESHTLIPYYRPFIREEKRLMFDGDYLLNNRTAKIIFSGQHILNYGNEWRWCNTCANSDFMKYGFTYWHTYHQLPSMLNCYKHGTPLHSECNNCGFKYSHFKDYLLPPNDGLCPRCYYQINYISLEIEPLTLWLDSMSILSQQGWSNCNREEILEYIKHKLRLKEYFREVPFFHQMILIAFKRMSKSWLTINTLQKYFKNIYNDESVSEFHNKMLNVIQATHRGKIITPINMLLMLKVLKMEAKAEKLLMGL